MKRRTVESVFGAGSTWVIEFGADTPVFLPEDTFDPSGPYVCLQGEAAEKLRQIEVEGVNS
jgi:hypothetical protein